MATAKATLKTRKKLVINIFCRLRQLFMRRPSGVIFVGFSLFCFLCRCVRRSGNKISAAPDVFFQCFCFHCLYTGASMCLPISLAVSLLLIGSVVVAYAHCFHFCLPKLPVGVNGCYHSLLICRCSIFATSLSRSRRTCLMIVVLYNIADDCTHI